MEKFGIECVEDTEDGRVLLQTGDSTRTLEENAKGLKAMIKVLQSLD